MAETADAAQMWRIEYWVSTGGHSQGRFEHEFIDGDEDAISRIMELAVDLILSDSTGLNHQGKRRARSWLRLRPKVVEATEEWQHVRHIRASKLVDGEWHAVSWDLTPPSIDVRLADGRPSDG